MERCRRGQTSSTLMTSNLSATTLRCSQNPSCCQKRNSLVYIRPFAPPVLGSQRDFCTHATVRGIPLHNCERGRPVTFAFPQSLLYGRISEKEPNGDDIWGDPQDPTTARRAGLLSGLTQLNNWGKWCSTWGKTQTIVRKEEVPLMTSGEGWRRKLEDVEGLSRALPGDFLTGFDPKVDPCPTPAGLPPRTLFRKPPPDLEYFRYPKLVRKEMNLPLRAPDPKGTKVLVKRWESGWERNPYLSGLKDKMKSILETQGPPLLPRPTHLTIQGREVPSNLSKGIKDRIPTLTFSVDQGKSLGHDPGKEDQLHAHGEGGPQLGQEPTLKIFGGQCQGLILKVPTQPRSPIEEDALIYDSLERFAATTKCKDVRQISITNEGPTVIRYQWLRHPPTPLLRALLSNPGSVLNLECSSPVPGTVRPPVDLFRAHTYEEFQEMGTCPCLLGGGQTMKPRVLQMVKSPCYDFHFQELPGALLPGQSMKFEIIFRPRAPGFHSETLYLLTHPQVGEGTYALKLHGICMDPEVMRTREQEPVINPRWINNKIGKLVIAREGKSLLTTILDRVLYSHGPDNSTVPYGRVTSETLFYAHNPHLIYHYGVAEKSLKFIQGLLFKLLPKARVDLEPIMCPRNIHLLYYELVWSSVPNDLLWSEFKTQETEELLSELAVNSRILIKPRVFKARPLLARILSQTQTSLSVLMDEVSSAIQTVQNTFMETNSYLTPVLRLQIRDSILKERAAKMAQDEKERALKELEDNMEMEKERLAAEVNGSRVIWEELEGEEGQGDTKTKIDAWTQSENVDKSKSGEGDGPPPPTILPDPEEEERLFNQEIDTELTRIQSLKSQQGKLLHVETLLEAGFERILSVLDIGSSLRGFDYRPSSLFGSQEKIVPRNFCS